jgi:hypothetical protein
MSFDSKTKNITMKALTVQFDLESRSGDLYERLLNVFIKTWELHGLIPLEVHRISPPEQFREKYSFDSNTRKLEIWAENFDQDTIFVDCDMMMLADISDGFGFVKDVGYTIRKPTKLPFNGGVVFMRYTDYAKEFLSKWREVNERMYHDAVFHNKYRSKYGGINQASFGWMLENGYHADKVPEVYNLCQPFIDWENAKMIHVKSGLRKDVKNKKFHGNRGEIVKKWYEYESM